MQQIKVMVTFSLIQDGYLEDDTHPHMQLYSYSVSVICGTTVIDQNADFLLKASHIKSYIKKTNIPKNT